jgi:hypothetical protein
MVAMLMGDQEAQRRVGRDQVGSERPHALDRACGSKSSVDDQPIAFRLDNEAVAARPTPQDEHAQRPFFTMPLPAGRAEEKRGTETALAYMMSPAAGRRRDERRDDGEQWHP